MKEIKNDIQIQEFADFIRVVDKEIEHAQVRLISAANVQMLLHYWKLGNFILFAQKKLGWGGKIIDKISKAIRDKYPEKKGYSPRNLIYMRQFANLYPLDIIKQMIVANEELRDISVEKILLIAKTLNEYEIERPALLPLLSQNLITQEPPAQLQDIITQEPPAQLQVVDLEENIFGQEVPAQIQDISEALFTITQEPLAQLQVAGLERIQFGQEVLAQIEQIFINSPIAKINWASHMVLMDSKLPLGKRYWYMKEAFEFGWSSNIRN